MVLGAQETRTKIVCTVGPASSDPEILRALIRAGMDVARINFSHGTHAEHADSIEHLRRVADEEHATVAILADLQGPKLRLGELSSPIDLKPGDWIALTEGSADGEAHVLPVPHPELIRGARVGGRWLFDDGAVEAIIREVRPRAVIAQVVVGGRLSSCKGVNAPGATGALVALTEKDGADAAFAASQGVDFVALSFVQSEKDLTTLRETLDRCPGGRGIALVAKIETRGAIDALDAILGACDAAMVARGDLGLEISPHELPVLQKQIIRRCNRLGIPVITATQMLQSMVGHPRPTRAETSDVANAILDGTDAIMLSAETAVGQHPVKAVDVLREVSASTERTLATSDFQLESAEGLSSDGAHRIADAVCDATARMASAVNAHLIVTVTASGYTARRIARQRPLQPVVALTPNAQVLRQLALVWGVAPLSVPPFDGADAMLESVSRSLLDVGYASHGDVVVVAAGLPTGGAGTTNLLKVHRINGNPSLPHASSTTEV